ncbi:MAG TPA: cellulase family glycosylhydrolase [Polyangiaceae bacterium]|nr:cellulase family glycosylhydrolase [Polyangiaceae bacterium]
MRRVNPVLAVTASVGLAALSAACGSDSNGMAANMAGTSGGGSAQAGGGAAQAGSTTTGGTAAGGSSATTAGTANVGGGRPTGWLYTDGSKLKLSDGKGSGGVWVGRGVNLDDIFFCGYNNSLWMPAPADELKKVVEGLISGWKPTFIRLSLSMASQQTVSWFADTEKYQKPMLDVMSALGQHDGVYVLLTLRSDASMIGQDMADGDPEATGIPSDSTTTPDKAKFPTGTDAVYTALVDTFKNDKFVLFGLTNEPGGNKLSNDQIRSALDHAVGTIRAEEDKLGVPHHVVSVQGQGWTSDISFYAEKPLTYDNVVYEVHGYPPPAKSYTYDNIPVVIGEYGSLDAGSAPAFFADLETKQIPSLAWDFDSYSNCAPDLVEVTQSSSDLKPSDWGKVVQAYLLAHAK